MITFSMEWNYLHVNKSKEFKKIMLLKYHWMQSSCGVSWKKLWSPCDCAYKNDKGGFNSETRFTKGASMEKGLHQRLITLLDNHHSSSWIYWPSCKCINQYKMPFNYPFSILVNEYTLQLDWNGFCSQFEVANWTCPHPVKYCINYWWLILSPPCGTSAMNHMNCLLVAFKSCPWNW